MQSHNTYSKDFKWQLYDSAASRNELFGYDQQHLMRVQETYNNTYLSDDTTPGCDVSMAPLDYYRDLRVKQNEKAIIGFTDATPNLYDDNIIPGEPTIEQPNLHKNWQTFTTAATPPLAKGCPVSYTPHEPVEIAPRHGNYWLADLNARLYERQLINSAIENPYANFYGRQAWLNLLAQNMPNDNDPYLHRIETPEDSFAYQLTNHGQPATYRY